MKSHLTLIASKRQSPATRAGLVFAFVLLAGSPSGWATDSDIGPLSAASVLGGEPVSVTAPQERTPDPYVVERVAIPLTPMQANEPGADPLESEPNAPRGGTLALAPAFTRIEQDDPAWVLSGTWTDHSVAPASGGSYRRNASAFSSAEIQFEGRWISVGFIADRFSGEAEVFIDGVSQGLIDLYRNGSAVAAAPVSAYFDGLAPGLHSLSIQVLGTANPFSANTRVQLDYVDYGDGSPLPDGDFEEDDERLLVSGGWTAVADAGASGGSYIRSTSGTAWFPFSGNSFSLHTIAYVNGGKARLFVNGVYLDTIDMFEPVFQPSAVPRVFSYDGLGAGPHVLQISTYEETTTIDQLVTPGSGPFIDPNPPVTGVTRFEADHPSIRYNGLPFSHTATSWERIANIIANRASAGEYVYSAAVDDTIEFDFEGEWLGIGFATDRFGGQAEIAINGELVETIDLYTRYEDTASRYYPNLGAGPHTVTIRVLGTRHPNASSTRVHLDFFDVWDGQPLSEGSFEEDDERLAFSRGWSRWIDADASGGAYGYSGVNVDATVWFPFTGDSVTWQGFTRFTYADVELRLNGISLGLFDLYGYEELPRAFSFNDLGPGPHVLEVRGYRSQPVTVDAFITPAIGPDIPTPPAAPFVRLEENHPAMRYNGDPYRTMPQSWARQSAFQSSAGFHLSSSTPGDRWALDFEGDWINLGFRSTASSGTAEVIIDGVSRGIVETANGVNNAKSFVFGDLGPGLHSVEVVVISGAIIPDYVDIWNGQSTASGWYEPQLDNDPSGLFNFSSRRWWVIGSDTYARNNDFLAPFASSNNNIWFTFSGRDLSVLGYQRNNTSLQVVIDGVDRGVFDMSVTPPFRGQPTALHFADLGDGPHIVQVHLISAGLSTPPIDAFEVNPDGFLSYMPEILWYDTAAQESLPGAVNTGFATTIAIGDLNGDGIVSLIAPGLNGRLYVYRGDGQDAGNGTPIQWTSDLVGPAAEPALADITGDGMAEIVITGREGTFAFRHDGQLLWSNPGVVSYFPGEDFGWGGPTIGNLDLSPEPEIVISALGDALYVLDHLGNIVYSKPMPGNSPTVPLLADITGDGVLDIVVARGWTLEVIDYFNGGDVVWSRTLPDPIGTPASYGTFGGPAVADLTGDGRPEIIINWGHVVEALRDDGSVLWRYETHRNDLFRPSPITVADVTGDGQVNLVTASAVTLGFIVPNHLLMVIDHQGNLVWEQNVADNTASASGVAAQDLTGNGVWEILWNGRQDGFLVLNGPDGKRLFNEPWTGSGTVLDYPTLADVNGDGQAEVVVSGSNGIFVIGHPGRWADSRPVWNQHTYHINNINNDWSVPFVEQNSWMLHNTYRTQTPERDPACASADGQIIRPRIAELSPEPGVVLPSGVKLVISGRVIPVNAAQPLLNAWVDDQPVDLLDASGAFFATVELASGVNTLRVLAADRCGPAETELLLIGGGNADDPWSDLGDASVLLEARFAATTHDRTNERLLVEVQAHSPGAALSGPILMAVGTDADPSLGLLNADGFTPQGEPYVVMVPAGETLATGGLSPPRELALANPQRASVDFTPRWIAPVNQPPYFTSVPNTRANQDQAWTYAMGAADGNGDPLSFALLVGPPGMNLNHATLTWTPAQVGNFEVVVQVADGRGGTARQGFTLRVVDGSFNSPPVFTSTPPVQLPVGANYQYAAVALDADGDALSFSLGVAPAGMGVDAGTGQVSWANAQPGQHSVVLRVEDGRGGESSQAWTLFVGQPATTPAGPAFASVPPAYAAVGTQYRYGYSLNHGSSSPPVVSLVQSPATMQLDPLARVITWVPGVADLGARVVELLAVDGNGLEARQRFDLQVLASLPNQPPYLVSTPATTARIGALYSYSAEAIDPEFQALSWSLPNAPAGMLVDPATGEVSWVPTAPQPAQVSVTLQASDPLGAVASQSFQIQVRAANSAPVLSGKPPGSVIAGQFYSTRILASDADGDPLSFRLLTAPPGMSLHPRLGWLNWNTAGVVPGLYPVLLEVVDGWGGRDQFSFDLTVLIDDQPPSVSIAMQREPACRGESVNVCVEATDNVGISALSLLIDGQTRSLDSARCHLWTPQQAGLFTATAEAVDPSGLVGSSSRSLPVADCNDEERPVVTLISPLPDSAHHAPVSIVATIEDNTPEVLTWTVSLRREADGEAEILATGSGPVSSSEVAVFDPTRLAQGTYTIDILGNDGAQTGGVRFRLNSAEGFKPGRVRFFTADVVLPVAGIPLAIGRAYDSLDAGRHGNGDGDFGPGWRLLLSASVSDSSAEAPPGLSGFGALMSTEPFNSLTRVHVIKPNGERVGFTFDPKPKTFPSVFQYDVRFKPDPGVTDTLRAADGPAIVWALGAGFADFLIPYNPSRYELETVEGVVYLIDEDDGLLEIRDALGGVLTVTADGLHSSWGPTVDYVRDGSGRIVEILLPESSPGKSAGRLLYGYDALGNLVSMTDLAGNTSTFAYADPDHPHHVTDMFDQLGNPLARHVFDEDGRLIAHCPADGNINTFEGCSLFEQDVAGGVQTIFDPRGFRSDLFYDSAGLLSLRRDWYDDENFVEQQWANDETGRLLVYVDGDGGTTVREYDELGNETSRTEADGETWTWEYAACRDQWIRRCDPLGNCYEREFNSDCALIRETNPLGYSRQFDYDARGLLVRVVDELSQERHFAYDERGLPTAVTDADGRSTSFEYNGLGQIIRLTDRNGEVREFVYDDGQRLVEERWPGAGTVAEYEYNAVGLATKMESPNSTLEISYWPTGKTRRVNHTAPGAPTWWVEYEYDGNGNVTLVQDSAGGLTTYFYDGINRLTSVRQIGTDVVPKRVDIESTAMGLPTLVRRYGDLEAVTPGPVTEYSYDCLSCPTRLARIEHRQAGGALIQRLDYRRDAAQRIVGIEDDLGLHEFVLDGRGWLVAANHPPASAIPNGSTVWDAAGNWLSRPGQPGPVQLSYAQGEGGHRLLGDGNHVWTHTPEGQWSTRERLADGEVTELAHSRLQRIEAVETRSSGGGVISSASYVHALPGWRVSAERDGQIRHYLHDAENPKLALDGAGAVVWRRLLSRNVDRPLAIERNGELRWLLSDHIGTVRKEVDNAGQILAEYHYGPFGQQVSGPLPSLDDSLRFTGRDFDLPGKLAYYRARVYDPVSGRFVSEDPLEPWHYYYAGNNPLIFVDPNGETAAIEYAMIACTVSATVVAAAPIGMAVKYMLENAASGLQGGPVDTNAAGNSGFAPSGPGAILAAFLPCGLGAPATATGPNYAGSGNGG